MMISGSLGSLWCMGFSGCATLRTSHIRARTRAPLEVRRLTVAWAGARESGTVTPVELVYPVLRFDDQRDCFVVWLRWVAMESPPSPERPPAQGIRVELQLNRNTVLGPTIVYRRDLEQPVYLRAQRARAAEIIRAAARRGWLDLTLVIHGSIANAPYAAVYQVRDHEGEAIDTRPLAGTPLLQLQPSTPGDRWHVAGQASARFRLERVGEGRHHLTVIRGS